ncbi:MAG TPA: ABC transporter substrate-binding protein [Thermoplasmata archaeon]|nr:ABC transporter substrate-binding protein [Thermoplasmata archaeon]
MVGEERLSVDYARKLAVSIAVALVVLSVLSTIALAAPRSPSAPSPAATPFRVLRIGVGGLEVQNLNPNSMTLVMEFVIVFNVYSTLLSYDQTYQVRPDLAYAWEVAADKVNWTFHLVHTAYFTNPYAPNDRSHPVTADDVVFSYQIQQLATASIWNAYTTQIQSVVAVDPYTVRITTKVPFAGMSSALTGIPILPKYLWYPVAYPPVGKQDPNNIITNTPPVHPVGSGAMYMSDPTNTTFSTGPFILERSPNYYGGEYYCQFSRPNEVRYLLYSGTNVGLMVQDFKSGQSKLDALIAVDAPDYLKALPTNGDQGMFKWAVDSGFVGEFSVNVITPQIRAAYRWLSGSSSPLLLNDTVRLAIAMSINKPALIQSGLLGLGTVADTLVPDSNPWHYAIPADQQYKFDLQGARALLNAAGWAFDANNQPASATTTPLYKKGPSTSGINPLVFRLYTPDTHPEFAPMMGNISRWLFEAGIQTTGDSRYRYTPGVPDQGNYLKNGAFMDKAWKTADYDLWLWDWIFSPVSDPALDVLEVETTQAIGQHVSDNYYSNATFDQRWNDSLTITDPVARRQVTDELQKMLYDYHSYILPFYEWNLYAATTRSDLGSGWQDWGNWTQTPAATPDSDLPNLWFQVYPVDNPPPAIAAFQPISYVSGASTALDVVASDPDNEPLTYVWDFGDGATATTSTGTVNHAWATPGTYPVKVRVSDSEWPVCASTTATITPGSGGQNLPPQGLLDFNLGATTNGVSHGWVNHNISFNFTAIDPDGDEVNVTWDFGDGSAKVVDHVTGTSGSGAVVRHIHAYSTAGDYTLTLNFTDNKSGTGTHTVVKPYSIPIWNLPTGGGPTGPAGLNPWVNYGIPLAVLAVIALAVAAVVMRRRRTLREEAKGQEPGRPEPPPPPPPP